MTRHYDTVILGLGGMGSATAWQLARRGQRVLGLEQFGPVHNRGSSHGRTRVIRQAYFEHPSYVPLLRRAYELWREAEHESGHQLLTLCGGLMMGHPDSEVFAGTLHSAREHQLAHELFDADELRRRFPPFRLPADHRAFFETQAGLVHTEQAVCTHLDLAATYGAELHFEEPALTWTAHAGGGVTVTTAKATYHAATLVLAPGPWAPRLLAELQVPLIVERQVLCWFQPRGGVRPFMPGRFPIYIWQQNERLQPYGFPAMDGPNGGVKVALFRIPNAQTGAPETIDRAIHPADEAITRASAVTLLPDLTGPLVQATTCLYTCTPDLHFVMGLHPAHPQVALAAGFSGHGFKFASVIGEILADLASTGKSRHDLTFFRSERFLESGKIRG